MSRGKVILVLLGLVFASLFLVNSCERIDAGNVSALAKPVAIKEQVKRLKVNTMSWDSSRKRRATKGPPRAIQIKRSRRDCQSSFFILAEFLTFFCRLIPATFKTLSILPDHLRSLKWPMACSHSVAARLP